MAGTPDAGGYWMVASDGGIFSYGDAQVSGFARRFVHLNQPIVGMAPTPDGGGYWLVASDGGIFSYGDAPVLGFARRFVHLNQPIVGMAPAQTVGLLARGLRRRHLLLRRCSEFYGSTGAIRLNQPIVAMAAMPTGNGYWFSAADGGLFTFGDAPFQGSGSGRPGTGRGHGLRRWTHRAGASRSAGAPSPGAPRSLGRAPVGAARRRQLRAAAGRWGALGGAAGRPRDTSGGFNRLTQRPW